MRLVEPSRRATSLAGGGRELCGGARQRSARTGGMVERVTGVAGDVAMRAVAGWMLSVNGVRVTRGRVTAEEKVAA